MRACLRRNRPGPYQIQATTAVHSDASTAAETDWHQILELYDQLLAIAATPVVGETGGVAVAEVAGAAAALAAIDHLGLDRYHLFHATRAELLQRLSRDEEAVEAYTRALSLTTNNAELTFLTQRRDDVHQRRC